MTSSALTSIFIGGASASTQFLRMPSSGTTGGRIELVSGELMSPEDVVTPILRDCYSTDSSQGLLVSVNDRGVRNRTFRSILTENSERYQQGERRMDWFGKMTLSALLGWLDVSPRGDSTDVARCALQLFPRESALLPLTSVFQSPRRLSPARRGGMSVTSQSLYFGGSWSQDWQNLLDEEQGNR